MACGQHNIRRQCVDRPCAGLHHIQHRASRLVCTVCGSQLNQSRLDTVGSIAFAVGRHTQADLATVGHSSAESFERLQCPRGCSRDLDAIQMSRGCTNSMRHQPSACAMLRRSAACVRPRRRGERDANAEEATGEKQLLRLERPEASLWQPIQKDSSSAFDGPTAFRRDTFPLMAVRPPL